MVHVQELLPLVQVAKIHQSILYLETTLALTSAVMAISLMKRIFNVVNVIMVVLNAQGQEANNVKNVIPDTLWKMDSVFHIALKGLLKIPNFMNADSPIQPFVVPTVQLAHFRQIIVYLVNKVHFIISLIKQVDCVS